MQRELWLSIFSFIFLKHIETEYDHSAEKDTYANTVEVETSSKKKCQKKAIATIDYPAPLPRSFSKEVEEVLNNKSNYLFTV